jgi:uncharacterized membrane protein
MNYLKGVFFTLVALAIAQIVYYYPQVPEVVASHFDGLGDPNDWSGRNGFFGLYAAMLVLLIIVFIFAPRWSEKRARYGMKIPNKEYWLSPEHIDQTRAFFRRQMLVMGIVHLSLAIFTVQLVIEANFDQAPRLHHSIIWALGFYFAFLIGWLIYFFLHFRKP